jgi:hypothetical protein
MAERARQHIAPKSYLAAWAVDGTVSGHFVDDGRTTALSIRDAAVRKHIYGSLVSLSALLGCHIRPPWRARPGVQGLLV